MISQEKNYQDETSANYSAVRLKVESQNKGFEVEEDKITLTSDNNYEALGNQNISSVLSQIQDDGPAYGDTEKRDNLVNFRTCNKKTEAEHRPNNSIQNKDSQPDISLELEQIKSAAVQMSLASDKNTKWLQILLFVIVLFATVYYYFDLQARTAQLEETVRLQESNIKDSLSFYNKELTPGIDNINKLLHGVKQELGLFQKKDAVSSNTTLDIVNVLPEKETIQNDENINNLENKIVVLENELAAANKIIIAINENTSAMKELSKKVIDIEQIDDEIIEKSNVVIADKKKTNISGWVVNLASFSHKSRAEAVAEKITPSGFSPFIENASVNGEQMFRLVVSGFNERIEAENFVDLAANQYALQGGWIRYIESNKR
ncbi:MAG: SPOR domain-containing protein [Gammaproteobacteria bacterium]|nr:SPOR domain-containing protein [Gammaproteobacteria bacterium]